MRNINWDYIIYIAIMTFFWGVFIIGLIKTIDFIGYIVNYCVNNNVFHLCL